jgi:FtsH-binding integral membrane protein
MRGKYPTPGPRRSTSNLFDRVAIAFGSGLLAFVSGCLCWLTFAAFNRSAVTIAFLPPAWLWWFAAVMAVLGFMRMENLIAEVLRKTWRLIAAMWGTRE